MLHFNLYLSELLPKLNQNSTYTHTHAHIINMSILTYMRTHIRMYTQAHLHTYNTHVYFLWNVATVSSFEDVVLFLVVDRNLSMYECAFVPKSVWDPRVRSRVQLETFSLFRGPVMWSQLSSYPQHYAVSPLSYFFLSSWYTSIPLLRTGY